MGENDMEPFRVDVSDEVLNDLQTRLIPVKATRNMTAALIVGSSLAVYMAQAQKPEITRTELIRHDLSESIREVIQIRVDFAAGSAFPMHRHPGAEIAYVLAGSLEYQLDGNPPVALKAGESLFIPSGALHSARNVGSGNASELATYVVEKGKPLVEVIN
jgi:quercetin dioxygenase-like cupin family protein